MKRMTGNSELLYKNDCKCWPRAEAVSLLLASAAYPKYLTQIDDVIEIRRELETKAKMEIALVKAPTQLTSRMALGLGQEVRGAYRF